MSREIRGAEAFGELRAHIEGTVGRPSLLTEAATALELPEVVSNAAVLMFGGIETTEGMIANLLLHLLRNPAQLDSGARGPRARPGRRSRSRCGWNRRRRWSTGTRRATSSWPGRRSRGATS